MPSKARERKIWLAAHTYMNTHSVRLLTLALCCSRFLAAQPVDDTRAKQVIIFGRHAVRTPVLPNSILNNFSLQPYPEFSVSGVAVLTPNGRTNETLLGGYFRLWLTKEGLLTGHDSADANFVYFRANGTPLITETAQAFALGMLPAASVTVNSYAAPANDPLFNPVGAGVARLDYRMAVAAVNGRLGDNPQSLASAYAAESPSRARFCSTIPSAKLPCPRPRRVRSTSPRVPSALRPEIPLCRSKSEG